MEKGLKELLESAVLSEETKTAFQEAWNTKLDEVKTGLRESVETEVREEYASRFANDKNELVEAMDRMLTDAVKEQATQTVEATKALKEERARLTQAVKEARSEYKTRLASNLKVMEAFVLEQLKSELAEIAQDHRAIQEQRVTLQQEIAEQAGNYEAALQENVDRLQNFVMTKLSENINEVATEKRNLAEATVKSAKTLREHRLDLNNQTAARINKLESFVVEQLTKEISGLELDKRNLAEAKVRLFTESKQKMDETRKAFVARASKLVETTVEGHLRKEMGQLKEDIRAAKENLFGRRLFEAFQSEFMTSYLSEGTKVKKLMNKLDEAQLQLAESAKKVETATKLVETAERKAQISESRAARTKALNGILSPLGGKKREVMEGLLESVKTSNLKEAFQRYLPTVLAEGAKGSSTQGRRVLSETPANVKRTVALTGDRSVNRLAESARADEVQIETQENAEIIELRRLAGIEK